MRRRDKQARRGFTVAGLLLSVAVFLILSPFLAQSIGMGAERITAFTDRRKAFNRVAAVEALLRSPAFYCGLGIPLEPADYKRAFGNANYMPFNWAGPISAGKPPISVSQNNLPNCALLIAYAQPGSTYLSSNAMIKNAGDLIYLNTVPAANEIKSVGNGSYMDTQCWITFSGSIPQKNLLKVRSISGSRIGVQSFTGRSVSIQKGDRMFLFRAMVLVAERDVLYTYDYRTSGKQPRVFGIKDLRFEVDLQRQKLIVYVLARGDKKYDKPVKIMGAENWPSEYLSYWAGKEGDYQLFAERIVLNLPNCTDSNIVDRNDIAEQF